MSDTIDFTLATEEYNGVFGIASTLSGSNKFAAAKVMEIIQKEVSSKMEGDVLPKTITISFTRKVLDGFYISLTEKAKEEKTSTQDLLQIKSICALLKMKNRFEKFMETEIESLKESEDAFDDEFVAEPLDD